MDTAAAALYHPNPNIYPAADYNNNTALEFQFFDYLMLQDCFLDQNMPTTMADESSYYDDENISTINFSSTLLIQSDDQPPPPPPPPPSPSNLNMKCKGGNKKKGGHRVAFRTKSNLDIMDDGFKWRKYGKKMIKNNPNPRNYFKCKIGGCNVKKRVERDREDSRFVITTYEGVHNHESAACIVYYNNNPKPSTISNAWNLRDSFS